MKRRNFLETTLVASIVASVSPSALALEKRPPRILLRSSWQTVNIGDIAHTPGVLAILEKYFPEAEIRLWPSQIDIGLSDWLFDFDNDDERKAFPAAVLAMAKDFATARAKAAKGREFVEQRQRDMVSALKMVL